MKRTLHPSLAALCTLLGGQAAFAAQSIVPAGGTYVYNQNFNTLYMPGAAGNVAATPTWADNTTLPNWFFYYAGNAANAGTAAGASLAWFGADGSAAPNLTINSVGTASNSDRAFAYPSTGSRGEQAGIIVFQNTSALSVELTRIQYNGEVRRSNGDANITESIFVWYQKGATQAAALAFTTAPATTAVFPTGVATGPNAYYMDSGTQIPAARWTYVGGTGGTAVTQTFPIDATGITGVRVAPGQFIAVRFGNLNDTGVDALMGIDDLSITFTEVNAAISNSVSSVVRQINGTPLNPADDTIDFTLTVTGTGGVGAGWTTPAPFANSGSYGVPKNFSIPIATFNAAPHSVTVTTSDATSGATDNFTVTAPWPAIVASWSGYNYSDGGTELDATDDSVTYLATATGNYTGPTYDVAGFGPTQTVAYGNSATITTTPGATESLTFTDSADAAVTASLVLNNSAIIGTNSISGTPLKLLAAPSTGVARLWTLNGTTRQARQNSNPANVNHEILSSVVNLTAVGGVVVTGTLDAIVEPGASSGFEAADTFRFDLIVDGNTAAPISILGAANDTNGNGVLEGNATVGTELPGVNTAANTTKTFNFTGTLPDSANSVQIRIVGSSNSAGETYIVRNVNIALAPPGLLSSAGAPTRNNHGTDSAADDTIDVPITISPINLGASTGWASNLTAPDSPLTGLYATPNPVIIALAPPVLPATTRTVTLHDGLAPAITALPITVTPPGMTITAVASNVLRHDNGAGLADDTLTFDVNISGTNGGPRFVLSTDIGSVVTASNALTATPTLHAMTLTPAPEHGTVMVAVRDISYPTLVAYATVVVPPLAVPVTQYVLGQKDLGGGLSDVVTLAGTPSAAWYNYPGLRKTVNTNGGATAATITSEVISLAGVNGPVQFTGTLRAVDRTTGFEAGDTFVATLILDGVVATPVNLITPYDTVTVDGVMKGGAGAVDDEFNAAHAQDGSFSSTFALSYLIPDSVNSVQLVITGASDSVNETFIVENVLFAPGTADSDGDSIPDDYENANGLNPSSPDDKFLDLDNDGQNNYQEYLAGTAANNPNSNLQFTVTNFNAATGAFSITWTSVPGKNYRVQASNTAAAGSWADLTPNIPASPGSTTSLSGTLPGPVPARSFFSVRVVP